MGPEEILVLHVLMPISASVPGILWQEDAKAAGGFTGGLIEVYRGGKGAKVLSFQQNSPAFHVLRLA